MVKTIVWIVVALAAASPLLYFLWQRWRASRAEKSGTVMYATVRSYEAMKAFGKVSDVLRFKLWLQETGTTGREVKLESRVPAGQKIEVGMMLPVVIDPKDPNKVYPASAEAMKRVQHTGSRAMRRQMKKQKM